MKMCKNKKYSEGVPFGVLEKNMKYVPHFVGHLIYVPHVPHMWDSCGTKTRSPLDGDKFTDFWIDWDFEVLLGRPFWTARFGPPVLDRAPVLGRLFWTAHLLVQFSPRSSVRLLSSSAPHGSSNHES